MAVALTAAVKRYGGEVLTRRKVTSIRCDDTHATAVVTDGGEEYGCDVVISDVHPQRTLEMLGTRLIRPAYRQRISSYLRW